jgi:hypothetical protein
MAEAPEPVDVARIMREIRESIQHKRVEGLYTDEEVDSLVELRRRTWAEPSEVDPRLLGRLLGPSHDWNITVDYLIRSRRPGLAGRLLVLAKKAVRPFVRLYTDHLFSRQAQLNQYFYHLLLSSLRHSARLEVEAQALRSRLASLERELRARAGSGPGEGGA